MPAPSRVLEICGEGKTDIGACRSTAGKPRLNQNHRPMALCRCLVHRALWSSRRQMRVVRRALPHLQGKGLWQKVKFVKRNGSSITGRPVPSS